ncbi:hypothetical protein HMPREF1550_00433 [Actinomyces sp. oral taxon 877 str. F0543]|nr:hypothetical protein HMPREF1550_00433 [Actinomyces sp. oral taxon 877 str. F0543]
MKSMVLRAALRRVMLTAMAECEYLLFRKIVLFLLIVRLRGVSYLRSNRLLLGMELSI